VPAAMAAEVRRRIGATPGWLPRLAPLPWLVRALTELVDHPVAFAPPALCDLVALAVSQDNSCRYCYGIQRAVLRIHGYRDEQIDRLVRDAHMGDLTAGERAALDFARRLTRSNPRPGRSEHDAVVAAGLSPIVVAEVGAIAAAGNFANRVATLLALPAEPLAAFVQSRVFRVVRPLMAWRMRPRPKAPEPLPHPNDGPCARLVAALDGSPSARVLRHIIDDALASPVLPRRTKMLMLAVVGKALGCRYAQQEARDQLEIGRASCRERV